MRTVLCRCGSLYLYLLGAVTTWSLLSHNIVHCREIIKVLEMPSTAKWNGVVLAESDNIVMVEGNKYFPLSSLKMKYFQKCSKTSSCPWKGTANYFDIVVDGKTNSAAAWYYASPKPEAAQLKDHVAFWKGVNVS